MCDTVHLVAIGFDGWVMAEWLGRWTHQWAAEGVFEIVRNWVPTRDAIRPLLEFTLLPEYGDMFPWLLHTKQILSNYSPGVVVI